MKFYEFRMQSETRPSALIGLLAASAAMALLPKAAERIRIRVSMGCMSIKNENHTIAGDLNNERAYSGNKSILQYCTEPKTSFRLKHVDTRLGMLLVQSPLRCSFDRLYCKDTAHNGQPTSPHKLQDVKAICEKPEPLNPKLDAGQSQAVGAGSCSVGLCRPR